MSVAPEQIPGEALRRLARVFERFFAPQPQQAMVVARAGLGGVLFFSYLLKLPHVQALYGPEGLGGHALHARVPALLPGRPLEASLQLLYRVSSSELIWLLYATLLLASLAFALGFRTRTMGLLALVLHALFHARNYHAYAGWAVMIKPFLFFVIVSSAGRFGSLDAWLRRHEQPLVPMEQWVGPGWPVRLMQMQLCTLYAAAGWLRLMEPAWTSGDMLFVALDGRTYGRFDVDWFLLATPLRWCAWVALMLEPLAPLMLWLRGIGRWWALALIGLHASLEVLSRTDWWQPMMIPLLLVFLPPSWICTGLRAPRSLGLRLLRRSSA